jgi:hypothetical protein
MLAVPMLRNVAFRAASDPVAPARRVKELDQPDRRAEADPEWKLVADILPTE